ncbi:TerC family protein [Bordetella petrii]|uniref:TerC family protein n=1 Tax=Bordetella petrii TaxID=94624 RepID=UPI001A97CD72|nr:TerC family protein [Bordetella petrii]MBO1114312.1 TerC family protein [Bordetella petrii]
MEWLLDPAAWVGLLTLVVLEIVLGIDNLIFIAILADKLPPSQRDRARIVGLSLALLMRLGLLSVMSWLVTLTAPLFSIGPMTFSGRDLILLVGGLFLLFKGTLELHERLEGSQGVQASGPRVYASFWVIVTQIVVLDAVFSLDSVITAVGMVDHLAIMMIAVSVAIGIMLLASKPLTRFVNAHPTVVVLCLGFLLMIGFSLLAEAFGFKVPKGYLYAAIGFSVAIELLNQVARRNLLRLDATRPMRERTAGAVLRMLGKRPPDSEEVAASSADQPAVPAFGVEERNMVSGVLTLAERSIRSIMTPRTDVSWINIDDDAETIRRQLTEAPHSFFPICRGSLDEVIGIGRAKDLVADLITDGQVRRNRLRDPIIVHESIGILRLMDTLKRSRGQLVLVADEFGAIEGLVTPIDVFEAIAGEFPDEDELPDITAEQDDVWKIDGAADLHHVEQVLETEGLIDDSQDYSTLAGYLLARFGHLPQPGDSCEYDGSHHHFRFEVLELDGRRIASVRVERMPLAPAEAEAEADSH